MALFALRYTYTGDIDLVTKHRPEHRQYLGMLHEQGTLRAAGPLGAPGAGGGLLIVETQDVEGAQQIAAADPFTAHGVIVGVEVSSFTPSFGGELFTS